jgi:hypothetical protein
LKKIKNIVRGKPFSIVAITLLAYLAFAYFAVNPLAKRILPWIAENKLASHLSVEQVKFDPLRLILTIDHLRLTRLNDAPLAGFDRLYLNLETSGLLHFAWRLKDIRLTAPQVTLDIAPDGKLNWADLIAKLNEDKEPDDAGMPRVMIDHILVDRGNIEYADRDRSTPFKAVLQPLGVELDSLSTLPEDRGEYTIVGKLPEQGGTLKWKGDLGLNPLASNGKVDIQGIKLAKLMQVLEGHALPVRLTKGDLATSFTYRFAMAKTEPEPKPVAQLSNLILKLNQVAGELDANAGSPTALEVQGLSLALPQLDFSMQHGTQLTVKGLGVVLQQLTLTRENAPLFKLGEANINAVDFDLASNHLDVGEVLLKDGLVNANRSRDGAIDWQQLVAGLSSTEPAASAQADVPKKLDEKSEKSDKQKPFNFDIGSLQLQRWQAHFQDQQFIHPLGVTIQDMNLGLAVSNRDGGIRVSQLNSRVSGLAVQSSLYPQPAARLESISLENGSVDVASNSVNIGAIVLSGLQAQVLKEARKPLNWQAMLEQPAAVSAKADSKAAQKPGWAWSLERLALENSALHIEDKSTATPVMLDIQNAMLELRNSTQDIAKSRPFKASFQVKQGGTFDASGKLAILPMQADMQVKLAKLALKPFSPYVNQQALLKLNDGTANIGGKLAVRTDKSFSAKFQGGFSVNNLAISEEDTGATFLNWKSVSSDTLKLGLAPNQLHMDEMRIEQPVSKFIIYEDKTLNIKRILRPSPATANAPAQSAAAPADTKDSFPIIVERVRINNAELEFADLSLKPQFGTHINSLSGVVNGLSTNPETTAQVELDGKVDEYGSARIRGSLQPFKATEFTDLKLEFRNLEMNRLTPYSGKFAGRKIESGKLSVDLEYKIKQRQLAGQNKFVLNKLRLGERVESPDALSLPLDLAIALLEDSDGLIDLDLPVSGSLDDPQFSYGKVVWKAFVNVLGKIVTSPFRALGKLLGVSSDKLEAIVFDAGSATLAPQEQEKLKTIAGAISKRPTLTLKISPTFDHVADTAGLQELATRRDVLKEMGLKLPPGEQPGPIDLNNPKVQSAIEVLLKERSGGGRNLKMVNALKGYFKKSNPEDMPKYSEMLEQLKLTVTISEADLIALANARAQAMQGYLVESAAMDAKHIAISETTKVAGDGKMVNLKMDLAVAGK